MALWSGNSDVEVTMPSPGFRFGALAHFERFMIVSVAPLRGDRRGMLAREPVRW
jgi:hypothetical protein